MSANLLRFGLLQRAGVGLAAGQAEFCQYVENLPALAFHLAREIVDTNLTHPPLFKICYPKPLVVRRGGLPHGNGRSSKFPGCPIGL
jgi:hypothetical protein